MSDDSAVSDVSDPNLFDVCHHDDVYDEQEEDHRKLQLEALEEILAVDEEFSFNSSSSEEENAEGVQDGCQRETQQESFQPGIIQNPPTQTSCPADGSHNDVISFLVRMLHPPEAHSHQDFPPAASPGTAAPPASTAVMSTEAPPQAAAAPSHQVMASTSKDGWNIQPEFNNTQVHDGGDGQFEQYKVHYRKPDLDTVDESQFYLDTENVEFIRIDEPRNQRPYKQLEVLCRAQKREIEELTQKMEATVEEKCKEIRNLKHRLAQASGEVETVTESLSQCQQLLQQSKSDTSEACGKIRVLEVQVSSLCGTRDELIQKLQTAESTIENMTHHIEELQKSESLSRARNEHEAVITSLTSRHERELLVVREKLDVCKTSLCAKDEELAHVKSQLAEAIRELDMTKVGKAEIVNRLTQGLEESQRQCQAILEQSSSQEASRLRVQLQQVLTSERHAEDLCQALQKEIKDLKEQLNMYESASRLGVFTASSHSANRPCHDESIADLGITKTLNFDSPLAPTRPDGASASLRSELERCLCRNRQQRAELDKAAGHIQQLQGELQQTHSRLASLENTCADQQARLQEFDALNKLGDGGVKAVEARQQREIEDLKRDMNALLADIEDYKTRLREVGDSEAKLTEINAELKHQIAQMVNDFDLDKQAALQSIQRTMEAVNGQNLDKLRQDIEERCQSEKTMLLEDSNCKLDHLNQALRSTQIELDNVKTLYVRTCEEHSQREAELKEGHRIQLEEQLTQITNKLEKEKREWESFMRAKVEKKQEFRCKLQEESPKNKGTMISQDKLASAAGHQAELDQALADAKKQWEKEHETDIQQWISERNTYELKISRINGELFEYKQKLDLAVSEKLMFQKHAEDSKLNYQTQMKTLTEKHQEEIRDVMVKYDRQMWEFEEKLLEMYKQSAASLVNKHGSVANLPQSFQESDLPGKLHILEKIMKEKDAKLQELEKIVPEQKEVVLKKVSTNNNHVADSDGSFADFECHHGDLSEASHEKLRDHIKKLESLLHTMKQKCNREVSELKQQHQKESEISVRLREEKFQAELRYFLKEKEEHWKTRMETTMKQHEQALKQADEKHKCVLHETICEYEHKNVELLMITDEDKKFRSDKEMKQGESTSVGDTFFLRDRMKHEIALLEEKYFAEKATLERKVKQVEVEKGDEIVNLCLRQAEDERKLKETFNAELSILKAEHHNVIRQLEQELSLQKSEVDKACELTESLKKENEHYKLVVEQLQKEVERMKVSISDKRIKEQRAKWFLEAQEYINKEIKHGVEDQIKKEEVKIRDRLEKLNVAEEMMNEEGEKMSEKLEKMNEEEEKMRVKLEKLKKEEERIKKEQDNIKEWQKNKEQYEIGKQEEARQIAQIEVDRLQKKFVVELNTRVKAIQTQVEQQKMAWQEEAKHKLLEQRETVTKALYSHMERSLQETKSMLEMKMEEVKDNELMEMQEDMRKQVQNMQEEWKRERSDHDNRAKDEIERLKECYQAEVEAKLKACQERDLALEQAQRRELLFREEEQRLRLGLQKCQEDMEVDTKKHEALVEQVNALDGKHNMKIRKIKAKYNQELAELKAKHAEEKNSLLTCFHTHHEREREKVRTQAELERAALGRFSPLAAKVPQSGPRNVTSLKSQFHHLSTGVCIPAEKLTHPCSASPATPAPVIGTEVIDMFKVHAKADIRSALSKKVAEGIITSLEYSLDELSEHVKSLVAKQPGPAWSRPDSGSYKSPRQQLADDHEVVVSGKQTSCQPCHEVFTNNMPVSDQHLRPHHHTYHSHNNYEKSLEQQKSHPQLDQMDVFDSDRYQHPSPTVDNSWPAGHPCARSYLTPVTRKEHTPARYTPQLSPTVAADTRTMPTRLEAVQETNHDSSGLHSARHERRRIEARCLLEDWVQTGATPWKSSGDMLGGQRHDASSFIQSGFHSERWARRQRDESQYLISSSKYTNVTKRDPHYYSRARVFSDSVCQSTVSSNASTSFITLKTDDTH